VILVKIRRRFIAADFNNGKVVATRFIALNKKRRKNKRRNRGNTGKRKEDRGGRKDREPVNAALPLRPLRRCGKIHKTIFEAFGKSTKPW